MDLFSWAIHHIPKETIKKEDRIWLWDDNGRQSVLAVEEWEFRIYQYIYYEERFDIGDVPTLTDCCNIFEWFDYLIDTATLAYKKVDYYGEEFIKDLETAAVTQLDFYSGFLSDNLKEFVENWLKKIEEFEKNKVYVYYK